LSLSSYYLSLLHSSYCRLIEGIWWETVVQEIDVQQFFSGGCSNQSHSPFHPKRTFTFLSNSPHLSAKPSRKGISHDIPEKNPWTHSQSFLFYFFRLILH